MHYNKRKLLKVDNIKTDNNMKNVMKFFSFLIIALLTLSGCSQEKKDEKNKEEEKLNTVRVMKLEYSTIARNLDFSTVLEAYDKVAIAPNTPGRINQILVDVGSKVSQGQLLVKMDPTTYDQAKVTVDNLAVDFARISKLNESDNISKQTYDQTKAQLEAQKTSLANLETNTFLRAPFSGVIEAKNYEDGELYAAQPILSLVKLGTLKALINIPETYFPMMKKGMPITVKSNLYPDEEFKAEIDIVYPTIDPASHSFQVQVKIPNAKELLRPGMYATVSISFGEVETIVVPYLAALKLQGSNDRYVFLNDNGVAKRVAVKLGQRFDDKVELISDEIKVGDELITTGQARLNDGVKIQVTRGEE
jgi:RND family efflux transporter MFP subunit